MLSFMLGQKNPSCSLLLILFTSVPIDYTDKYCLTINNEKLVVFKQSKPIILRYNLVNETMMQFQSIFGKNIRTLWTKCLLFIKQLMIKICNTIQQSILSLQQMMKYNKFSQEINPWTYRNKDSNGSPSGPRPSKETTEPKDQKIIFKSSKLVPFTNKKQLSLREKQELTQQLQKIICSKIPKLTLECPNGSWTDKAQSKYKFIHFEHHHKPLKNKNKSKRLPFSSNSMRHHTEDSEIHSKRVEKAMNVYAKAFKIKRYFTEQKDYKNQFQSFQGQEKVMSTLCKTQEIRRPLDSIKIIKVNKANLSRQQTIKQGEIFDQILNIYDKKDKSMGGHLSQMKRTYNIKKLQKLIKKQKPVNIISLG